MSASQFSEMTLSERITLASRLQRIRYMEEQRRLVDEANAITRHPRGERSERDLAPPDELDEFIAQFLADTADIDIDKLIDSIDQSSRHVCVECGSALSVPQRGRLPDFCGPTCRKRAARRRRSTR